MTDWHTIREQARADIHSAAGRTVTHHPVGGSDQNIVAVWFDEYTSYEETGRGGVSTTAPEIEVQLSAFHTAPEIDDEFTVDTTRFAAIDVRPDGRGGARIPLREV